MKKAQKEKRQSSFAAIILAAGYSSRMKSFKPLLPIGELTAVERLMSSVRAAGIDDIIVVTGYSLSLIHIFFFIFAFIFKSIQYILFHGHIREQSVVLKKIAYISFFCRDIYFISMTEKNFFVNSDLSFVGSDTVSYTHLDVYKRQCVSHETIVNSMDGFRNLAKEYGLL